MKIKSKYQVWRNRRFDSIDDGNFQGTGVSYAVGPNSKNGFEIVSDVCDYCISEYETNPDQTRVARLRARQLGERTKPLPIDAFDGDVFVLVGPHTSPKRVIKALERIMQCIEVDGLLIGRDANRERVWEPLEQTEL